MSEIEMLVFLSVSQILIRQYIHVYPTSLSYLYVPIYTKIYPHMYIDVMVYIYI